MKRLKDKAVEVWESLWLIPYIVLALLSLTGKVAKGQFEIVPAVRFGLLTPQVREFLAQEWDLHEKDDPYLERGYCGYVELGKFADQPAWIVTKITKPDTVIGTPTRTGIDFRCFSLAAIPIHVHPPQSCETRDGPCYTEGLYAWQCMASESDRYVLTFYGYPFGIVQCARKANVTFWPLGVAGS